MYPPRSEDEPSPDRDPRRYVTREHRNGHRHSLHTKQVDELSHHLVDGLARLVVNQDHEIQQELDERVAAQETYHSAALSLAAAEHDRIRENAERARERIELEIERERKRRDAEDKAALHAEREATQAREVKERLRVKERLENEGRIRQQRETVEREIKETEARNAEQQRKDQELEAARKKAAEAELEEQRQAEAAAKAETAVRAEANAKAKLAAAQQRQPPSIAPIQPSTSSNQVSVQQPAPHATPAVSSSVSALSDQEKLHQRYVQLHASLKEVRRYVISESKKIPALKTKLGDWRRQIVKSMGQLTIDKTKNRKPMSEIQKILQEALKFSSPSIDVAPYLVSFPQVAGPLPMSGVFFYLINIFSKSVISQFISEASVSAKAADPIGVVAVTMFATANFKVNTTLPLIDVLLAKFHVCCPVLWGIYGDQKTPAGRTRIGWWKEDGRWVSEQRHFERMSGLGAGYAALTLRDFSKSRNENPFPNTQYWRAFAAISNVAPENVQPTHFIVLKAMVDGTVPRFIGFYGMAAMAALRYALVDLPARAPKSVAASQVQILPEVMKRDLKLTL